MVFRKEDDVFTSIRRQSDKTGIDIASVRDTIFTSISSHPWKLFTGVDWDGTPLVRTKDEKDMTGNPFKPYPHEREYLKHMVYTMMDPEIMMLIIEKNRQIMASYTALMVSWWKILNLPAQNVFLSRRKKETSVKLLKDKVRHTHILLPDWIKDRWQLTAEPKDVVTAIGTGSCITAVPETFADSESRGDSASEIIVDECAFQDHLAAILTSSLSMAKRITLISTPSNKVGGQIMQKYIKRAKDNAVRIDTPCEGLNIIRAKISEESATLCVFEVVHKTSEQSKKSWLHINESARKQEEELSWDHTDGNAYFPEVEVYGGAKVYGKVCTEFNPLLPVEVGHDFGVNRPALVFSQVDPIKVRIHVARAWLGKDIDPWSVCALYNYLISKSSLEEIAEHKLALYALKEAGITEPWFKQGFSYRHWAGHEAARPVPTGIGQKIQTYAEIYESMGIHLNPRWVPKERREFILRHLLKPRKEDNTPSILVDPYGAAMVLDGLTHGLVRPYDLKSKENRVEEPVDDHFYKDVYDALGYILVGVFSHVNWEGLTFTNKAFARESVPFELLGPRFPRYGDTSNTRQPLVSPDNPYSRW